MSVICENSKGWILDHAELINRVYFNVVSKIEQNSKLTQYSSSFTFCGHFFHILTPFMFDLEVSNVISTPIKKRKRSGRSKGLKDACSYFDAHLEIKIIKSALAELVALAQENGHLKVEVSTEDVISNNGVARECSTSFFNDICQEKLLECSGGNAAEKPVQANIYGQDYLIPNGSTFYCCDIQQLHLSLRGDSQFDFVLLDPPWWNKYIRRRKTKQENGGYKMMYNEEIGSLPVEGWLAPDALVGVWCTNCSRHEQDIISRWFPRWGLRLVATWFWVKVTKSGVPVCQFSPPPGKQPYERVLLGAAAARVDRLPPDGRCIVSVPSAIHSHKPPLSEVMKRYLPTQPRCLELFARYLQPNWVSAGDQVLALQNCKLYRQIQQSAC
uniref:Methyltransferase-like protein 4 n=2 Tax=Graphocephala atropunctata TaxID=36148 RepID=A0A1B6LC37_9HEMI